MSTALVWFRRDLRLEDHAALYHALRAHEQVYCGFVFDAEILDALTRRADRRVEFILASCLALDQVLSHHGSNLIVRHGRARDELPRLAAELKVSAVYANRDYEPAAIDRDRDVAERLRALGVAFESSKDQVIFETDEVLTKVGGTFSVFTPYKNAWLRKLDAYYLKGYPVERYTSRLAAGLKQAMPTLTSLGFEPTNLRALEIEPSAAGAKRLLDDFVGRIDRYDETRNFPAVKGPSYLSVHLRFGTVSIRTLARLAHARRSSGAETWLSELIWRDFYHQILAHHPRVVTRAFRPEYDAVVFDDDAARLAAWCEGRTGYPIIDAAMRQINQTGYMHNRLRMIVASFLTKDLHVHWRHGETYFATHLNDFDLAANNGGWQWAASSGCDAQPYFRIFNPVTQSERFDPNGKFIRRYVPELAALPTKLLHAPWLAAPVDQQAAGCVIGRDYPTPIVDHDEARKITLARYGAVKGATTTD
ncbi:MAG: deoxyribodipyrimidine photo-lyase [Burkholderiales bacterium]